MRFEARIGERFESRGLDVVWIPRGRNTRRGPDTAWIKAIRDDPRQGNTVEQRQRRGWRRPRRRTTLNGRLYNVSVSGAGVVAGVDDRAVPGAGVTVELEPGNFFDALIRRVETVEESGSAYYGLEYMLISDDYRAWLHEVSIAHRGQHALTPAALLDHGGLSARRADPQGPADALEEPRTPEEEADLARRHQRSRELATAFLPDPLYGIERTGASWLVAPRHTATEPTTDTGSGDEGDEEEDAPEMDSVGDHAVRSHREDPANPFRSASDVSRGRRKSDHVTVQPSGTPDEGNPLEAGSQAVDDLRP